jgi:hypothetical protein
VAGPRHLRQGEEKQATLYCQHRQPCTACISHMYCLNQPHVQHTTYRMSQHPLHVLQPRRVPGPWALYKDWQSRQPSRCHSLASLACAAAQGGPGPWTLYQI